MSKQRNPGQKKTGIAHFFAAAAYSAAGFKYMLGETPFRHEIFAGAIVIVLLLFAGAAPLHVIVTLCLAIITLAIEAINSAIELVVDRTSPEISEYAKNAKNLGSFAVLCMLCATGIFAAYALWQALAD